MPWGSVDCSDYIFVADRIHGDLDDAAGEAAVYGLTSFLTNDVGIDLGTANTLIYVRGRGIVLNEPSVVAIGTDDRGVVAVGTEAKKMLGKTPDEIMAIRPMKDGVIADYEITEAMLRLFIQMVLKRRMLFRPRIVVCVPSGITEVEKRAVRDSAEHAGARDVYLVPEPIAAAVGVGLPVDEASGNMVIDIGGGTTEIAVIALSGIVADSSIRIAGDEFDEAIVQYLRSTYNLLVGDQTAENIKINIGSAFPLQDEIEMEVKGRDLVTGIPRTMIINSVEIRDAMRESVSQVISSIKSALESTPPELAADIVDRGIVVTGGGALLRGLDTLIREETNLPVSIVDDPLTCVVRGTGKILDDLEKYEKVLIPARRS